jgi:multimeric flavodoxin WrbA
MKIAIINGSPRKNGATFKILNYFKETLENSNSETNVTFINLIDYNFKYCIGCQHCYKTGKCIISNDRIEEVHNIIRNSDGLIFGSPSYATNISGLYRNFYDRVNMLVGQLLHRKPCINIVTYENISLKTLGIMKEMVAYAGGYNIYSKAVKNPFNNDPLNNKLKGGIEKASKVLLKKLKEIKPRYFPFYTQKLYLTRL